MSQKLLKIIAIGVAGFVVPYAVLSMLTNFLLLPSFTVSSLLLLSAIASYAPPQGIPIALSILAIGCAFSIALFLISPAFSASPQRGGLITIPLAATLTTFVALTTYGFCRRGRLDRRP